MKFVINVYESGGFVRLHYSNCTRIPDEPSEPDMWCRFREITEVACWRERNFPGHPFRPCNICRPHTELG